MNPHASLRHQNTGRHAATRRAREARVRYCLIRALHLARANDNQGRVSAMSLHDSLAWLGPDYKPDDIEHLMALMADLVSLGYAQPSDARTEKEQPFGPDYLQYKLTGDGAKFMAGAIAATAMIDDGRIVKEDGQS